jgi:hypothetical protein
MKDPWDNNTTGAKAGHLLLAENFKPKMPAAL